MMMVLEKLLFATLAVTLSTSCVIAVLLAFSTPLRRRYSARWLYVAWVVVALRLLVPANMSMPIAHLSIPVPDRIMIGETADAAAQTGKEELIAGELVAQVQESPYRSVSVPQILSVIWLVGAMGFLMLQTAAYLRFKRRLRCHRPEPVPESIRSMLERVGADMHLTALPRIGVHAGVPAPLLMGLFHPTLLLPHAAYKDSELTFVLRHELVHYRRHDLWCKLLLLLARAVHWFNPLVVLMVLDAGKQMEMSCDDAVVTGLQNSQRADYCEIILNTLPVRGGPAMTTSLGSLKENTKMRIYNLFDGTKKRRGIASLCSVILATAAIGGLVGYTTASATAGPSPGDGGQAAANADSRLTLVEKEFTIAQLQSMDISGIEVIVPTENISITRGGDALKFSYYQRSDSEYDFTTVDDGGHTRTYWALLRLTQGRADDPQRTVHITLPENYTPKTILARTVSGNISVKGCKVDGIGIWTFSQSGTVDLDDCEANFVKALSNTGNVNVRGQLADSNMICSDTGAVLFQPGDSVRNYHFEFATRPSNTITINGKPFAGGQFEWNRGAPKTVWVESGYVEVSNKEDVEQREIPGEGTAVFTITDQVR